MPKPSQSNEWANLGLNLGLFWTLRMKKMPKANEGIEWGIWAKTLVKISTIGFDISIHKRQIFLAYKSIRGTAKECGDYANFNGQIFMEYFNVECVVHCLQISAHSLAIENVMAENIWPRKSWHFARKINVFLCFWDSWKSLGFTKWERGPWP
jgi:hypothetical protein